MAKKPPPPVEPKPEPDLQSFGQFQQEYENALNGVRAAAAEGTPADIDAALDVLVDATAKLEIATQAEALSTG